MTIDLHPDFLALQKYFYESKQWECSNIQLGSESKEYGACTFEMNGQKVLFRVAKITPTKIGHFVTVWKRIGKGPTMPYDMADDIDAYVITARNKNHFGVFVFPKEVLVQKGIVSKNGTGGKLGIRVYPSWDITDNPQAKRTQAWQVNYFSEISYKE